tara:strand:+ start:527 stop:1321 length:795 start_codon:yes stop_codon:yes gene_type:complete
MVLSNPQVSKAASALADAFVNRTTIISLPDECWPSTAAEAVQIQLSLLDRIGLDASGYKAGFTNPPLLEKAGPDGPMAGVMFREFTVLSGGTLQRMDIGAGTLVEAEVGFRMGADLPAREREYTDVEVLASVDSAIVGIELAVPRIADPLNQPMLHLAADNGAAMGFVAGPDIPEWKTRDLKSLDIELLFDGEIVSEGMPLSARCDEVWSLTWIVNHFSSRGVGIKAGDYMTTGAAAVPKLLGQVSDVRARFAGIGDVDVTFVD